MKKIKNRVTLRTAIGADTYAKLLKVCEQQDRSVSYLLRIALEKYLK